jgi:murein DD-endopeptidase MepM/ murein hydrolase activator NlpD
MKKTSVACVVSVVALVLGVVYPVYGQMDFSEDSGMPSFDSLYGPIAQNKVETDHYADNPAPPFHSTTLQEYAPVQKAASSFPGNIQFKLHIVPCKWTYKVAFSGTPGSAASHEGMDFVHNKSSVPHVDVLASADGTVAYVRTGCPESTRFSHNTSLREAGAGWGNHVVIHHGKGIYTRYAHLAPKSIKLRVGDTVNAGDFVGEMGNSGRSETRHLHFEVGYKKTWFAPHKSSQSFDIVLNPGKFLP